MSSNCSNYNIIKFKYILNKFFLLMFNSAFFTSSIYKHTNFFFAYFIVFFIWINTQYF